MKLESKDLVSRLKMDEDGTGKKELENQMIWAATPAVTVELKELTNFTLVC